MIFIIFILLIQRVATGRGLNSGRFLLGICHHLIAPLLMANNTKSFLLCVLIFINGLAITPHLKEVMVNL